MTQSIDTVAKAWRMRIKGTDLYMIPVHGYGRYKTSFNNIGKVYTERKPPRRNPVYVSQAQVAKYLLDDDGRGKLNNTKSMLEVVECVVINLPIEPERIKAARDEWKRRERVKTYARMQPHGIVEWIAISTRAANIIGFGTSEAAACEQLAILHGIPVW